MKKIIFALLIALSALSAQASSEDAWRMVYEDIENDIFKFVVKNNEGEEVRHCILLDKISEILINEGENIHLVRSSNQYDYKGLIRYWFILVRSAPTVDIYVTFDRVGWTEIVGFNFNGASIDSVVINVQQEGLKEC